MAKNPGGRPPSLTNERILVAEDILKGDTTTEEFIDDRGELKTKTVIKNQYRAIMLNDEELVDAINDRMQEINEGNKTFSYRTFQRYKRYTINKEKETPEEIDIYGSFTQEQEELFQMFCRLLKKHLRIQKEALFQSLQDAPKDWQKWAWIIERKFDDWNIRHKQENTSSVHVYNVSQEEQQEIDSVLSQELGV